MLYYVKIRSTAVEELVKIVPHKIALGPRVVMKQG